jgi:oxalate decarboxylase/phosphoglucose isomerase-like protein (cupin superfamily)
MEKLKVTTSFKDDRGEIIDLIENESINAVTLITFCEGAVRGNHYHKQTTQWNYLLSGSIKLVSQVPGEQLVETVMNPGDLIVTRPEVRHALVGLADSELMVFTKGPRGGKEYESDTFRLEAPIATGT